MILSKIDPFIRWSAKLVVGVCVLSGGCSDDDSSVGDGSGTAGDTETGGASTMTAGMSATGAMTAGSGSMTADGGDTTAAADSGDTAADTAGDTAADDTTGGGGTTGGSGEETGGDTGDTGGSSDDGGNMMDDGPPELCEAPGNLVSCDAAADSPTIFNALGLGCTGGPDEVIPIVGEGFNYVDPTSWAVATQLGTYIDPTTSEPLWGPREGETVLVLSSGDAGVPDAAGVVTHTALNDDDNGNPSYKPLPAPITAVSGSGAAPFVGCDGVGDCSDTLQAQWALGGDEANDLIWFQFATQVPGGTHGFSVDFSYFSEEFPEFVNDTFNDMFIVWSNSETYTGNLCFINDQPCTITALCDGDDSCPNLAFCGDTFNCANPDPNPPELANTGFGTEGATGWFQIKGSAEPLELLELTFAVFDMGDQQYDTMVLLDNFQWDCEGCTPTEVNPCGVVDPV